MRRKEVEQPAIFGPGVLIEQPEQDLSELRAGIFAGMFERERPGDDLAAGIVTAGFVLLARLDGANLAVEDQPFFPNVLFLLFESSCTSVRP